jgi:hypothetical protein
LTAKKKQPRYLEEPSALKRPSTGAIDPDTSGGTAFVWRLARVDLDGKSGWTRLADDHVVSLHTIMSEIEGTTPIRLRFDGRLRAIPLTDVCRAAQERLEELQNDDAGELCELRLGYDKWRVWGFLEGSIFDVLWWDHEHTVCQELPKRVRRR